MGSRQGHASDLAGSGAHGDESSAGRRSAEPRRIGWPFAIVIGLLFALVVSIGSSVVTSGARASTPSPRAELEAAWSSVAASAHGTATPVPSTSALWGFEITVLGLRLPNSVSVEQQRLIAFVDEYATWLNYPVYNPVGLRRDFDRLRTDYDALLTALGTA
jgi:hypothetical protein